jgi:hypothetical protein
VCGDTTEERGGGGPGYFITLSDNALDYFASETVEKRKVKHKKKGGNVCPYLIH